MTVTSINRPTPARIVEFCHWQSGQPKFTAKADWRKSADDAGFVDVTDADMPRVISTLRDMAAAEYHHANLLAAEHNGKRVIEIDEDDEEGFADPGSSDRLEVLHFKGATLNDL
ncbi:MAG: hypothetical protein ABIV36_10995, partial [Sphingobium limneticum]